MANRDRVAGMRGNSGAYLLARLDRDGHTELAAAVRSGELSAYAAAFEVGIRRKPTALQGLMREWRRLHPTSGWLS